MTFAPPYVPGLSADHQSTLGELSMLLAAKSTRNAVRRRYYEYRNQLRDLGISIPPSMRNVETVVGWPAKAVDSLSSRTVLDGFTTPGIDSDALGLDALWDENHMDVEAPQAHTSCLVHSVAFLAVTAGDVDAGDPEVIITARSAEFATGIWDRRRRGLTSALSVISVDAEGDPDYMVMYVPNVAIMMRREGSTWDLRESRHDFGVPVEPLVFKPALDRPFGQSRISRAVMSLTDSAVRTLLRSEVSAEFYSAPQRYILGADEDMFTDEDGNPIPAWQAVLGRILAIGRDEDGQVPTVGQFAQQTMQPHFEQLRGLAALFASETSLPLNALGIVQDNPSSAEAIFAAKEDLVIESQQWARSLSPAWSRTVRTALAMTDNSPAAVAEYAKLRPRWINPATPSVVSASDAMVKQISAMPWIGESTVALEELGYDQDQIERLLADKRRAAGIAGIGALIAAGQASGDTS